MCACCESDSIPGRRNCLVWPAFSSNSCVFLAITWKNLHSQPSTRLAFPKKKKLLLGVPASPWPYMGLFSCCGWVSKKTSVVNSKRSSLNHTLLEPFVGLMENSRYPFLLFHCKKNRRRTLTLRRQSLESSQMNCLCRKPFEELQNSYDKISKCRNKEFQKVKKGVKNYYKLSAIHPKKYFSKQIVSVFLVFLYPKVYTTNCRYLQRFENIVFRYSRYFTSFKVALTSLCSTSLSFSENQNSRELLCLS